MIWPDEVVDTVTVRHQRIRGDGIDLHVAVAGDGPPVILLHGFPETWRSWRKQVAPLVQAGFSVWMLDLRGYGWSDRPRAREAYHLRHLVADVAALVRGQDARARTSAGMTGEGSSLGRSRASIPSWWTAS